jgi:hypothetical protein
MARKIDTLTNSLGVLVMMQPRRKVVKAATVGGVGDGSATYSEPWQGKMAPTRRDRNLQRNQSTEGTPTSGGHHGNRTTEAGTNRGKGSGGVSVVVSCVS